MSKNWFVRCDRGDMTVRVHAFGGPRDEADTYRIPICRNWRMPTPPFRRWADLSMVSGTAGADLVHSHTWYANFAGHVASLLGGMPHVISAHSLEPMRPWKAEQLGGGYRVSSSWIEKSHT